MNDGWEYLEKFDIGVLEAVGKKTNLRHVLVRMEHDVAKKTVHCFINGTADDNALKDLPLKTEFMVRIKCADKEEGIYLTTKGKACVKETGNGPEGVQALLDVRITGIAAYRKVVDEKGIDDLVTLYNDMTSREDKRARVINDYHHR